jgi:hypothetical protein
MAVSTVNERHNVQQQRIANGVNSGQLTPHETQHLENREAKINQQVHAERQAKGGHLDQQERQQVNREQAHVSQEIHNEKHNDAHPR